jgi:hypothetical protein
MIFAQRIENGHGKVLPDSQGMQKHLTLAWHYSSKFVAINMLLRIYARTLAQVKNFDLSIVASSSIPAVRRSSCAFP